MIIYEVNLTVNPEVADDYRNWLYDHVKALLKLDGFHAAKLYERDTDEAGGNGECWSVHYFLDSRAALNNYLEHHAEHLREEAMRRFGGKFSANRRVLEPIEKFVKKGEELLIGDH